jgi:hypothetical protein
MDRNSTTAIVVGVAMRLYSRPGSPFFYAEISCGRKVKRVSTGVPCGAKTRSYAIEVATRREAELVEEIRRASSSDLVSAATLFLNHGGGLRASTLDHYAQKLALLIDAFGNRPLCDVTPTAIRDYMAARRHETSDIQVRRELTALSSVMEYAADRRLAGAPEAARHDLKFVLGQAAVWLNKHEIYQRKGVWPGPEMAHAS